MKKIITLCFFAFTMLFAAQTVSAQYSEEINSLASKKTMELQKSVKFAGDTESQVYEAYQGYFNKMARIEKIESAGQSVSEADRKAVAAMLPTKFKSIFSEEEYTRYLAFDHEQKK